MPFGYTVNLNEMSGFDALYVGIGTIAPFANAVSDVVTLIVDTKGIVPPYGQIRTSPFDHGVTIVTFSDTTVAVVGIPQSPVPSHWPTARTL